MNDEEQPNATLALMRSVRSELAKLTETIADQSNKIGTMAQSVTSLKFEVNGLRRDLGVYGTTVEHHTQRLERYENRLDEIERTIEAYEAQ